MARPVKQLGKWRIRWVDADGHRCSEVYDEHADAAFKLREHQIEGEQVRRGFRAAQPPDKTFNELCDYWIDKRAVRKRSRKDDESIIRRHLRPSFGPLKLRELGVAQVDDFVLGRAQPRQEDDREPPHPVDLDAERGGGPRLVGQGAEDQ